MQLFILGKQRSIEGVQAKDRIRGPYSHTLNNVNSVLMKQNRKVEATIGFEPMNKGFADLPLSHLGTSPLKKHSAVSDQLLSLTAECLLLSLWSGRRDSNPRQPRWQRGALPLSYSRIIVMQILIMKKPSQLCNK